MTPRDGSAFRADLYTALVENAREYAIFAIEVDGSIASWNLGAERITGWAEDEAIGQSTSIIFTSSDIAAREHEKELRTAAERGRSEDRRWHVRKDGSRFFANGVVEPLRDEVGATRGFFKIMRDDTERHRMEEELRRANEAKDRFLAIVSHELRTPLNSIVGWTQLLRSGTLSAEESERALETVARNATAQTRLIEDVLDVSRIISGKLWLQTISVDLAPIVFEVIDASRPAAAAKSIALEAPVNCSEAMVSGDPDRLRQIVSNLVGNAIKFTPSGGGVEVHLECDNREVKVEIRDSGQGIPADELEHIFEPFRQVDDLTTRHHGGLGLGLAIVKQLVELQGGTVEAESAGPGKGATFRVTLPALSTGLTERPGPSDSAREIGAMPSLDGVRVLVVDDVADARALVTSQLASCGAEVETASTAEEALWMIEGGRFDVLVSDIAMPGEDGFSLIRKVRSLESRRIARIPAIALTAFAGNEQRRRAMVAGFQTYLVKPIDPTELVAAVSNLVSRGRDSVDGN